MNMCVEWRRWAGGREGGRDGRTDGQTDLGCTFDELLGFLEA